MIIWEGREKEDIPHGWQLLISELLTIKTVNRLPQVVLSTALADILTRVVRDSFTMAMVNTGSATSTLVPKIRSGPR